MARPREAIETQSERGKRGNRGLQNPTALILSAPVEPPDWLNTQAGRDCFHDLQLPLIQAGILQTLDIPNLALMAQFWSDYIEARDIIRSVAGSAAQYIISKEVDAVNKGCYVKGKDELFTWMMESLKQYQALLSKFAGSPIDRTRIVFKPQKKASGVAGIFDEGAA